MERKESSPAYAWFVVGVLLMSYIFSFIDRQILALMVGPIKTDLGISDTQMSLLLGFSFAVFYTLCGIPLGRMADSKSRRGIIAGGMVLWSIMTATCGLAQHYWHLLLSRVGVGVGEAALSPAAYSLIADYFPRERRATALSVYSMGIYIGSGIAFLLGGYVIAYAAAQGVVDLPIVGETRPWQVVFFILGIAGIFASLAFFAVREPARAAGHTGAPPLASVLAYIKQNRRTVLCHNFGFALIAFSSYGAASWIPTFMIRTYGWDIQHIGLAYGLITMIFGSAGIVAGGRISDYLSRRGFSDAPLRVGLGGALACIPFGLLYPLMPTGEGAILMMAPTVFFLAMPFGVAPAAIQDIMPSAMRGQASALYLFIVNLIGLGFGPTAVALVTDRVYHDEAALRYSLLWVGGVALTGAVLLLWAGLKPYRESWQRLHRPTATA